MLVLSQTSKLRELPLIFSASHGHSFFKLYVSFERQSYTEMGEQNLTSDILLPQFGPKAQG